ncbi:MAG: amidohydrolase [Bacillota bacterium]|mgnify:CR=1 FL=1|jgi:imidazolonepropionase-like amidohydrolase|nr:amidohydrolase [Bacillota bacterium]HOB91810.1 amidohydrolase [Bacillota bacterium]HPZ53933.1 amidohydrolase [Bacillota bacterium]HQD18127.1 amidohydrolase [Bacillota bacterium]
MKAILNAEIETITNGRISRGAIVFDETGIKAVGKSVDIPEGAEVIDAQGRIVTPGIIEAHSHAGLYEDGFPTDGDYNEMTDPITPHLQAIDGFKPSDVGTLEAAAAGVTTMYISQGSANVICGIGAVVKTWGTSFDDQIVNPAAGMKMALGENPKRVYGSKDKTPSTRMGVAALLRKTLADAVNYQEKKAYYSEKGKDKEPLARDLKLEAICRVLSGELPVRCHAHRAIDMLTFMRIADEFGLKYCFEHATECVQVMEELKRRDIPVVIGPAMSSRSKVEVFHRTFRSVVKAVEAGLTVAITSDHHVTPMKYLPVYAALAVREGLSSSDALKILTINPAKILGVDDRLGSIEVGKDADLVIWSSDPLDARSRAEKVFIRGRSLPDALMKSDLRPGEEVWMS